MKYRKIDNDLRIAYNGIEGSFSHEMALKLFSGVDSILRPVPDLRTLESGLVEGRYDIGIMPAINSGAGPVRQTLDTLLNYRGMLHIVDSFGLLVDQRIGGFCDPNGIKYIASHPIAIEQCKGYLAQQFIYYERINCEDTALAVRDLATDHSGDSNHYPKNTAVVGSKVAFQMYGVPMFTLRNIADRGEENVTAFLLIERRKSIPQSLTRDEARSLGIGVNGLE